MSGIHHATRERLEALLRYLDVQISRKEHLGFGTAGLRTFRRDLDGILKSHGDRK